jgi:hypothetical protein
MAEKILSTDETLRRLGVLLRQLCAKRAHMEVRIVIVDGTIKVIHMNHSMLAANLPPVPPGV